MKWQIAMTVLTDFEMFFSKIIFGINMDHHMSQMRKVMKKLVTNFLCEFMSFFDRSIVSDSNIQLHIKSVPYPAGFNITHLCDTFNMLCGMNDFMKHFGINTVQHSGEYFFC